MSNIVTVDRILAVLNLGHDKTAIVETLLPHVKNWVREYTKNNFFARVNRKTGVPGVYVSSQSIYVTATDSELSIYDSDSQFVANEFSADTDVLIEDSRYNNGIFSCTEVAVGKLTIDEMYTGLLLSENYTDEAISVYQIAWPPGIVMPIAKLIEFDMTKLNPALKSFSVADRREVYAGSGDYPPGLKARFYPWKRLYA